MDWYEQAVWGGAGLVLSLRTWDDTEWKDTHKLLR